MRTFDSPFPLRASTWAVATNLLLFTVLFLILARWEKQPFVPLPVARSLGLHSCHAPELTVELRIGADGGVRTPRRALLEGELPTTLRGALTRFERMSVSSGKRSWDEYEDGRRATRLDLLVRAHKDAPWGAVRRVLAEAKALGWDQVRFAAKPYAYDVHSDAEVRFLGVERVEGGYEGAFFCMLVRPEAPVAECTVALRGGLPEFSLDGVPVRDLDYIRRNSAATPRVVVKPSDEARVLHVVAALDATVEEQRGVPCVE